MKRIGVIIHRIKNSKIFLLHTGWGKVKYFNLENNLELGKYFEGNSYCGDINCKSVVVYEESPNLHDLEVQNIEPIENYLNVGIIRTEYYKDIIFETEILKSFDASDKNIVELPSKIIAFTDRYRLFEKKYYNDDKYCSLDINDKSSALLYLLFRINNYDSPSSNDFLHAYQDAKRKVDGYDLVKMVENVKVYVYRIGGTLRGSDNYMFAKHYLKTDYGYEDDAFLDSFLPAISSCLYSYNERHEGWMNYPQKREYTYLEEENLAKEKTNEIRPLAINALKTEYNKDIHICTLMFNELYGSIYSKGRKYYDYLGEWGAILGIASAIWEPADFINDFPFYRMTTENFIERIANHNKFFIAQYS